MIDAPSLAVPAFIAGILTFLAPCTLPLVPAYISFIGGTTAKDLADPIHAAHAKRRVLINGLLYIIGFSTVFITLGSLFAAAGALLAPYRIWLSRIGGVLIIFFGLYLMHVFNTRWFSFLAREKRFHVATALTPGRPTSALLFGATFALGWTPCVGPVLGSILLLASVKGSIGAGALLLTIFSLGLAIPFLSIALLLGKASTYIQKISPFLNVISFIGGLLLLILGFLLLTDMFALWVSSVYRLFGFISMERLLDYL